MIDPAGHLPIMGEAQPNLPRQVMVDEHFGSHCKGGGREVIASTRSRRFLKKFQSLVMDFLPELPQGKHQNVTAWYENDSFRQSTAKNFLKPSSVEDGCAQG